MLTGVSCQNIYGLYDIIFYFRKNVHEHEGFVRHYRSCRSDITNHGDFDCEDNSLRMTDTSMAEWSMKILSNVRRVRRLIFGTDKAIG